MGSSLRESRNVELSCLYYLKTSFASDWNDITLVKSFKDVYTKTISLPIVCVSLIDKSNPALEIGSTTLDPRYLISVNIFARSEGQRLDLADYIVSKLKDGWVHYTHSHVSGDNTTLDKTIDGRDQVTEFIGDSRLDFGNSADEKDLHRHIISLRVRKAS